MRAGSKMTHGIPSYEEKVKNSLMSLADIQFVRKCYKNEQVRIQLITAVHFLL